MSEQNIDEEKMNVFLFYKSIYDRELKRRIDLDNSINIPITILTLVIGLNSIYIHKFLFRELGIIQILSVIIGVTIIMSIFFIIKSYNNLFKGFKYQNLPLTKEIREYETKDMPEYNSKVEEEYKLSFEDYIINQLIETTDSHISFNDRRSLDIYKAKVFLIISLILTSIQLIIVTFK